VAALTALPDVVDAVSDRAEVLLDGGVRRGTEMVMAVALGASACFVARPYLFGLATAGEAGVTRVLELLDGELDRSLALLGVATAAEARGAHARLLRHA
jgi:isopentenyl diphosphate isomerase/L-lactate dehydrogenase-like FMN-dependent dehydrogenase